MATYREFFHLKGDSFSIDPVRDAAQYFGVTELPARIRERIESDFIAARSVPKFVVYALYGGGKTHTLAFIRHVLLTDAHFTTNYPTEPRTLELAPIQAKERWLRMHQRLMDAIGLDAVKLAVSELMTGAMSGQDPIATFDARGVLGHGEAALCQSQAQIFRALLFGGRQETLAWEWLRGRVLKAEEKEILNVQKNLTEVPDFINALLNVAALYWRATGKKLVLLMDEGEALGALSNLDAIEEYVTAFRRLAGDENKVLGFVVASQSAAAGGRLPDIILHPAIEGRLGGKPAYIEIAPFTEVVEAKQFITDTLAYLIDQEAAKATLEAAGLDGEPEFFPFTEDAVDRIAQAVTSDPDLMRPRSIISIMADALAMAYLKHGHNVDHPTELIDERIIEASLFPSQ